MRWPFAFVGLTFWPPFVSRQKVEEKHSNAVVISNRKNLVNVPQKRRLVAT